MAAGLARASADGQRSVVWTFSGGPLVFEVPADTRPAPYSKGAGQSIGPNSSRSGAHLSS